MGFRDLILFQINFTKKSLQLELDAFLKNTNGGGSITKQAYSEARRKILPTAFIEMSDGIIDWYYNDHDDFKKFRDYRLSAIDGSITQLPDTARLRDAYGYAEGNGAPMARAKVAALYDLENDLILSSVIDRYKTGERDLAKHLINDLRKKGLKNDLILFDRGYCGAWFYWYLEHSEVKYLMRAKEDTQIKAAQNSQRVQRLLRQAKFPVIKTFDGYKFHPITWPNGFAKEQLLSLDFIENKQNVLCLGAVGTGKTYLATALGVKACSLGKKVRFYRASDLCAELLEKHRSGNLTRTLKQLQKLDLLILDELGFIPFDKTSSQLLFNVISNSYEQQAVIITSNLQFGRWNEVFGDDRLTAALIDRLVHRAHILAFSGPSLRYEEAMLAQGGDQPDEE